MDGRTHRTAGELAGVAAALYRNRTETDWIRIIVRAAAARFGGRWGAQGPDVFEPASGGRYHRDLLHSYSTAATILATADGLLLWIENECTRRADAAKEAARLADTFFASIAHTAAQLFWEACAGIATGLVAGYLSHLALDAVTPAGLPLVVASERTLFASPARAVARRATVRASARVLASVA